MDTLPHFEIYLVEEDSPLQFAPVLAQPYNFFHHSYPPLNTPEPEVTGVV